MSPLEPSPLVMRTIGAPSRAGMAAGLCFFPKMLAAFNPAGVKRLLAAPIVVRNARRLHLNFIPSFLSARPANGYPATGADAFTTFALPTISMSESPGIHSTAMQARDGDLPGEK